MKKTPTTTDTPALKLVGGEAIKVDADGFPVTYTDPTPAPAADDGVFELSDDITPTNPETQTVSDTNTAVLDTPPADTATPAADAGPPAPTPAPAAKKARKGLPVPSPTNNPPPLKPGQDGRIPAAKKTRTTASVTAGKFGPDVPPEVDAEMPLTDLTRDRRIQMRASLTDKETVQKYSDLYADDPNMLPAVRVLEIPESERETLGLASRYVLWDGFQRTEARQQAGLKTIAVKLAQGTWELARRLALSANSTHGLPRTFADLRKAFQAVIDDDELRAKIMEEGKKMGGGTIALARAVGASTGYVFETLKQMGLQVRGDKIVKRPAEPVKPAAPVEPEYANHAERHESKEAIKSRATAALLHEMQFAAASIQRRYYELLERPDAASILSEMASQFGVPIADHETITEAKDGQPSKTERQTYWPAVDAVLTTLDRVKEEHAKMGVGSAGTTPTSPEVPAATS